MSEHELWPAPYRGASAVSATVTIPGSKSVTNRALILAAQASGPSILRKPLVSRDSELMSDGLRALGIHISSDEDNLGESSWKVTPSALRGPARIDVGNAGTVMRFLPPLAALAHGDITFDGDSRAYERPIGPVIKALEELGIEIEHEGRYSLPMVVKATGKVPGGELTIDASKSSQFLSALLLVAPSMTHGIRVHHKGDALPSMPHIDMTVQMLRDFGATVHVDKSSEIWTVEPGVLRAQDLTIEPDLSNASPFLSIAMV